MKPFALTLTGVLMLGLCACGETEKSPAPEVRSVAQTASHDAMEHGQHAMDQTMDGIGEATGTIRAIAEGGTSLTIAHGPFSGGIRMGAMTMAFESMGGANLSGLAAGDEVAFRVKRGRDGSFRIMAICNTGTDGADCLAGTPQTSAP